VRERHEELEVANLGLDPEHVFHHLNGAGRG